MLRRLKTPPPPYQEQTRRVFFLNRLLIVSYPLGGMLIMIFFATSNANLGFQLVLGWFLLIAILSTRVRCPRCHHGLIRRDRGPFTVKKCPKCGLDLVE